MAPNATNTYNASKLINETKVAHGVDGAGFGNGLVTSNNTNATTNTYNASRLINETKVAHGVDGAGFGNGLQKVNATANGTSSVQSKAADEWHDLQKARIEAAAEAAWVKKETENAEVRAKYEAFKLDVAKNMTLENPWKNGEMSSGTDLPTDGKQDVPMSERKSLTYPEAPTGIKYVNTSATVQTGAMSVSSIEKTLEGIFNLDPHPAAEAAKLISNAMKVTDDKK